MGLASPAENERSKSPCAHFSEGQPDVRMGAARKTLKEGELLSHDGPVKGFYLHRAVRRHW